MKEEPKAAFHRHLRAWRVHKGLTQAYVAEKLDKVHTTIGRWESGKMALTSEDLGRLAALYECTPSQLLAAPRNADLVKKLDRMQRVVETMSPETFDHFLAIGEKISGER